MADQMELAWLAGFVDGEGCVCITKDAPRHELVLRICNTNRESILEAARIGGGKIETYVSQQNPRNKPAYSVRWGNHKALALLKLLRPLLRIKGPQVDVAIEFMTAMPHVGRVGPLRLTVEEIMKREEMRLKMRALNKRGS